MLKKFARKPDLLFFLALCILFLVKNIYFFCDNYAHPGTWGINRTSSWVWETIQVMSMPALGSLSLCGALLFAIRGQRKRALYFVAVFLIIFPFHPLLMSPVYTYDGFFLLRPERSVTDRIVTATVTYGHFILLAFFLAGMLFAYIQDKPATLFYKILLGATIALIIACQVAEHYDPACLVLHIHAIFYGGVAAWLFVALNYLGYTGARVLRHILFYFSVAAGVAGAYCIWRLLPYASDDMVRFPFLLSAIGSVILVLLYHLSPRSIITVMAPFIPLLGAAVIIIYYEVSPVSVNEHPVIIRSVMHWSDGNLWLATLACVTPALLIPFFRKPPVISK